MDSNLPATRPDAPLAPRRASARRPSRCRARQPISVAFLPLALIAFIVLAFAHRRLDVPRHRRLRA